MTTALPLPHAAPYDQSASQSGNLSISSQLQYKLWLRIAHRLQRGDALMTNRAFLLAMEEEYTELTQIQPEGSTRKQLWDMIAKVNEHHPETFLHNGVENAITHAFRINSERLHWNASDIEEHGTGAIRRFVRGQMREALRHIGVETHRLDLVNCVRHAAQETRARETGSPDLKVLDSPSSPDADSPANHNRTPPITKTEEQPNLPLEVGEETRQAIADGLLNADDLNERNTAQQRIRGEIEHEETEKIPERIDAFTERGILSASDAENLRKVYSSDAPLKRQDREFVRNKIEEKVRPAIEETIDFLEILDALRRLPEHRDPALRFLFRHSSAVFNGENLDAAISELSADTSLCENVLAVADRTDQETSMIAVRLPPYNKALTLDIDTPASAEFLDDFRNLDRAAFSDCLNSPELETRQKSSAGLLTLVSLIDHASRQTPFFLALREMRICRQLEDIVNSAKSPDQARSKVEAFLDRRMLYLYTDLTAQEKDAAHKRAAELLKSPTEQKNNKKQEVELDGLDPYEVEQGVSIARVSTRVAGRSRYVPHKIMADPDDADKFLIVRKDNETGNIVPAMHRGKKRYVEKDRDGFWKMAK